MKNVLIALKKLLADVAKLRDKKLAAEVAAVVAVIGASFGLHLTPAEAAGVIGSVAVVAGVVERLV